MSFENIDWDDIRAKLPTEKTDEEKARRKKMFAEIDNGKCVIRISIIDICTQKQVLAIITW